MTVNRVKTIKLGNIDYSDHWEVKISSECEIEEVRVKCNGIGDVSVFFEEPDNRDTDSVVVKFRVKKVKNGHHIGLDDVPHSKIFYYDRQCYLLSISR